MKKKIRESRDSISDSQKSTLNSTAKVAGSMSKSFLLASELGLWMSLPVVGGALLGHFIDLKIGTSPVFTLLLILLGSLIIFFRLYLFVKNSDKLIG